MHYDRDVVIVGAGPVGLWLSCELQLAGISVTVLDRRKIRVEARALGMHGRTVEVFSLRGVQDRFLARSAAVKVTHFALLKNPIDLSICDSRVPFTRFIPQNVTEELLEDYARSIGVDIRRGVAVDDIEFGEDHVTVTGATDDEPLTLTARYVVGADGARSIVRRLAKIEFEGHPAVSTWFTGDVTLDTPPSLPIFSIVNQRGLLMVANHGDGVHYRIVITEAEDGGKTRKDPVTLEEMRAAALKIGGSDYGMHDATWLSRFDDESRLAAQYRKGRVFLAGDAAHIHLAASGQGMNAGIQDAMNLGWKLASVLKGHAPEALLDTYEPERRPVGAYLHESTMAQNTLQTTYTPHGMALREMFNDMLLMPETNAYFANRISGFGLRYDAPLLDIAPSDTKLIGARIRDMDVRLDDGTETNLYALMTKGQWLHLSLTPGVTAPPPAWLDEAEIVFVTGTVTAEGKMLDGLDAVLVRPDGYIGQVWEKVASTQSSVKELQSVG